MRHSIFPKSPKVEDLFHAQVEAARAIDSMGAIVEDVDELKASVISLDAKHDALKLDFSTFRAKVLAWAGGGAIVGGAVMELLMRLAFK